MNEDFNENAYLQHLEEVILEKRVLEEEEENE